MWHALYEKSLVECLVLVSVRFKLNKGEEQLDN